MERNILITSLSSASDRQKHSYYRFENGNGVEYCDGLSVAEAGAKYLLASVRIDTIIAVGGPHACHADENISRTLLKEWTSFHSENTGELSEYGFFQYRISQFLNGLDLEAVDVLQDISEVRRTQLLSGYQKLLDLLSRDYSGARPDRIFHIMAGREDHAALMKEAFGELSEHDLLWLKRYMYTQLNAAMKLSSREDSENLEICFVRMRNSNEKDYVPAQNVTELIRTLREYDAERLNIYMDMQGLESAEGYMILGVLAVLGDDANNPVSFREIITTAELPGSFVSEIDNSEKKRYEINRLVSGMSAFIRYGKVDEILHYWESRGISDRHVDYLLYAMKRIDEGISLCNIQDLESGIRLLKLTLDSAPQETGASFESGIFRILENTIRMDYGPLLEGDDLDELELVRWALRKKFYQQAVTIVESRMPADMITNRVLYYAPDEAALKEFTKGLNEIYWVTAPKDRWYFKDIDHYFIKNYGRSALPPIDPKIDREKQYTELRMKTLQENGGDSTLMQAYSVLSDQPQLIERLLCAYYKAATLRNQVAHASDIAPDPDARGENEHLKMLVDAIQEFIAAFDAVRAYMKEHDIHPEPPLRLDPEKFRGYTFNHRKARKRPDRKPRAEGKDGKDGNTVRVQNAGTDVKTAETGSGKRISITIEIPK